jgi:hypothetical protein
MISWPCHSGFAMTYAAGQGDAMRRKSQFSLRCTTKGLATVVFIISMKVALAQESCKNDLRQLNDLDTNNQQYKAASGICIFMRNQTKLDLKYADLYRRCVDGIEGENQAHSYEVKAAALKTLISNNCIGNRPKGVGDFLQ